jgi:cytochrome P450
MISVTGIDFSVKGNVLGTLAEVVEAEDPIAISIDGHHIRDPPMPKGLPIVGNYYEIYPDHLGNHQRLFDQYGPIIKTVNMGRTVYETRDPNVAAIVFSESDFFSKTITKDHPLYGIKDQEAGIFLGDSDNENWKVVHKFLPPAFGPKAVRHYAPTMQKTVEDAYKVFDALDEQGEAWNVYQYMLKLGSQAIGKLVLGMDFQHFSSADAPTHRMVLCIAESLALNKKISSRGNWHASLPFGDPKRLRETKHEMETMLEAAIAEMVGSGINDLELQDAALQASCIIGEHTSPSSIQESRSAL